MPRSHRGGIRRGAGRGVTRTRSTFGELSAHKTSSITDPSHASISKRRGAKVGDKGAAKLVKVDVLSKDDFGRMPVLSSQLVCSPTKEGSGTFRVSSAGGSRVGRKSQALARGSKKVLTGTGDEKQEPWTKCCSPVTGLLCLSATSLSSTPITLAARQGLKVHFGPSLVIVNTVGGGEILELGLNLERGVVLEEVLEKANEQLGPELTVRATLTSAKDPFAWVGRLPSIPKVGGSGLYQLSVQRPPQPHRGEMSMRKELEEVTRQLEGVVRVSHGEGESLVLVGHMLHALAYTNHISRTFQTQLQHVWPPIKQQKGKVDLVKGEKWFIVSLKENKGGGALHRQLYVHHELNSLGRVAHLEQGVFGASHTFLAMVELSKDLGRVAESLHMLEVDEACLPSCTSTRYMVDSLGFYVVDGCFPSPCAADLKDKFAKEMQVHGAVGFRRGDSEQSFSLQFVNPSGLERATGSNLATAFSLVIKSQARKVEAVSSGEPEHRRLVGPSCEEICKGAGAGQSIDDGAGNAEKKEKAAEDDRGKSGKGKTDSKKKDLKEKKVKVKNAADKTCKEDTGSEGIGDKILREGTTKKSGSTQQMEKSVFQSTDIRERKKSDGKGISVEGLSRSRVSEAEKPRGASEGEMFLPKSEVVVAHEGEENLTQQVAPMAKEEKLVETDKRDVEDDEKDKLEAVSCKTCATLREDQLLSIRWKKTGNLTTYLHNLATFLGHFPNLKVKQDENVALVFPSQLQLELTLSSMATKDTNSVQKLQLAEKQVILEPAKSHQQKYGVVVQGNPSPQVRAVVEKAGEVEVVEGREVTSLWWESRIVFLWALAQLGAEALPCKINFRFKQPRPKVNGGKAILPQTSKKSSRVFLTEEQIFSFDWKVEKLYRDTSDEKALCRHLTAFIKGVRCADMNVTERGLVVSFHCLNDLEEALAKFCTSVSNTLEKLEKRQRAFTLLPSHGSYGVFSAVRVNPVHFSKFTKCQPKICSVWFPTKHSLVRALRDPFIQRTYPALWIDYRNIYILHKREERSLVALKPLPLPQNHGLSYNITCPQLAQLLDQCRRTAERLGLQPLHGHIPSNRLAKTGYQRSHLPKENAVSTMACEKQERRFLAKKLLLVRAVTVEQAWSTIKLMLQHKADKLTGPTLRELKVARVEDFLRDSLGIEEENAMKVTNEEEVSNISFTSVLASIEEEDVNNEDAVEDDPEEVMPRRELPPSLQKLEAEHKAALLKLNLNSVIGRMCEKEEEEQDKVDLEELGAGKSFEESISCDDEAFCRQEKETCAGDLQQLENGLLSTQSPEAGLPGVEEGLGGGVGGIEQVEGDDILDNVKRETAEVQADTSEHLGCEKEGRELDQPKEEVGESELEEEGGGCFQSQFRQENAFAYLVEEDGEVGITIKGVEGKTGEGELGGNTITKIVGESKNSSHDSGLSRSNEVSFVENEQEGEVESLQEEAEAFSGGVSTVEEKSVENQKVEESLAKDGEAIERDAGVEVSKEQDGSRNFQFLTLKVKARVAASTTPTTPSVEEVTEDFAWFDCPGLKVTEVEDGLQVDIEDRQLGIAAMEGLKHKYSITQQVPMVADPSTGLYTLTFTDSKLMRYTATRQHFLQFCKEGEEPVLSRGIGKQEVLVSFARKEAAVRAVESTLRDENFSGLAVVTACRP